MPTAGATPDDAIRVVDAAAWEAWLTEHHGDADGVWLKLAKKGSGERSLTADEGTEGALCFGWIDGHRKGFDATWFLQRYSPRRRRSAWSAINVQRAEGLIGDATARAAFDALGKTDRYAAILALLKAPTPERRVAELRRAVERLLAG
jgi:uncharacterized protein YdeI (YjbR/CyaY-like superfamily)